MTPGEGPVVCPTGVDVHYEVELALIMGKEVRDLDAADEKGALDAIESMSQVAAKSLSTQPFLYSQKKKNERLTLSPSIQTGYAIGIDMTARNVQNEAKKKGLPWSIAKGFDTFLPMSGVIPKSAIPDPHAAELYLSVNGTTKQSDSTNLMLFRIPQILSDISKVMTIHKGDIILTGTPKGVGPVVPGDVMRAGVKVDGKEIEEGKIEIPVEASKRAYSFAET